MQWFSICYQKIHSLKIDYFISLYTLVSIQKHLNHSFSNYRLKVMTSFILQAMKLKISYKVIFLTQFLNFPKKKKKKGYHLLSRIFSPLGLMILYFLSQVYFFPSSTTIHFIIFLKMNV